MYSPNKVPGQWRAHGRYIARESVTGDYHNAGFDDRIEGLPPGESLSRWQIEGDPRLWKLIISPEFGERLDLNRLTRELMGQVERDIGTRLQWVAVAHFNTEHAHVHVALRGIRDDGTALNFERDYIREGIRKHAENLCTLQLGLRTELDALTAERREIDARRYTSLDQLINRASSTAHPRADSQHFVFTVLQSDVGRRVQMTDRDQNVAGRLAVLRSMGLADEIVPETWRIRRDFATVLKAMQRAGDRQKMLAAHGALLSDERLRIEMLDCRKLKTLEGRVLVHGEDELTGRNYLLLEGTDAKVHMVHHTPEIAQARSQGRMRANSFVRLRRFFENGRPMLEVEDFGDADKVLRNKRFIRERASALLRRGVVPSEDGWGGWLGRYQAALAEAGADRHRSKEMDRDPGER